MFRFVTYLGDDGKEHCVRFFSEDALWEWLQEWKSKTGSFPREFCVYKADCVYDGS